MTTPHLFVAAAVLVAASTAGAQQAARADSTPVPVPAVGSEAPDFTFRPVTVKGISPATAKLSDYRGQTVVLWFFIKARTRG